MLRRHTRTNESARSRAIRRHDELDHLNDNNGTDDNDDNRTKTDVDDRTTRDADDPLALLRAFEHELEQRH
jgi:hypothetical protein